MTELDVEEIVQHHISPILDRRNCAVWVGSGLSGAKYPSWNDTVKRLCAACGVVPPSDFRALRSEDLMAVAQSCKDRDKGIYRATLCSLFDEHSGVPDTRATALVGLPFCVFLTTNWDPLLDVAAKNRFGLRARVFSYPDLQYEFLQHPAPPVCHLHGSAGNADFARFVLSTSEYEEAYDAGSSLLHGFLQQILISKDILFIGCSLDEPFMVPVFDQVHAIVQGIERARGSRDNTRRCALLPKRSWSLKSPAKKSRDERDQLDTQDRLAEQKEAERFTSLGIEPVRYRATRDHSYLDAILDRLARLAISTTPGPTGSIDPRGPNP